MELPRWLTTNQTARYLNVPLSTVRKKCKEGLLPVSPHGRPYRVDRVALERWGDENEKISINQRNVI